MGGEFELHLVLNAFSLVPDYAKIKNTIRYLVEEGVRLFIIFLRKLFDSPLHQAY